MQTILVTAVLVICCAFGICTYVQKVRHGSCCGTHEAPEKRVRVTDRDKSHYPYSCILTIDGMTCSNCVRRVENALNGLDGVWCTAVDLGQRKALLRLKLRPDERALREAVRNAGYIVLSVQEEAR